MPAGYERLGESTNFMRKKESGKSKKRGRGCLRGKHPQVNSSEATGLGNRQTKEATKTTKIHALDISSGKTAKKRKGQNRKWRSYT